MRISAIVKLGAIFGAGVAAYAVFVRPWHLRWGATDEELAQAWPGDEFVPDPKIDAIHAITIDAPPEDVWPWIAQLGQKKAGFYSYRWLENLAGSKMPSVEEIVPEWQDIKPGDRVWTYPTVGLEVAEVEAGRTLVLKRDWSFHLRPLDGGRRTRLVIRNRGFYENPDPKTGEPVKFDFGPVGNLLYWRGIFEPAHFIMERKMMLGIKRLAERERKRREEAVPAGAL
jgi:hypothetical protein